MGGFFPILDSSWWKKKRVFCTWAGYDTMGMLMMQTLHNQLMQSPRYTGREFQNHVFTLW